MSSLNDDDSHGVVSINTANIITWPTSTTSWRYKLDKKTRPKQISRWLYQRKPLRIAAFALSVSNGNNYEIKPPTTQYGLNNSIQQDCGKVEISKHRDVNYVITPVCNRLVIAGANAPVGVAIFQSVVRRVKVGYWNFVDSAQKLVTIATCLERSENKCRSVPTILILKKIGADQFNTFWDYWSPSEL